MSLTDYEFLKGIGISLVIVVGYKIYTDQKIKDLEYNYELKELKSKLGELESRIENLEDFKFRFYQLYNTSNNNNNRFRIWSNSESELTSSEEEV